MSASIDARAAEIEELLIGIWAELLDVEVVHPEDDFFALGGASLTGFRLLTRVRSELNVRVGARILTKNPVLRDLARSLAEQIERSENPS